MHFDCLPAHAEQIHGVVETENISEHEYDGHAIEIIESIGDGGIVLDCGSGTPTYHSRVVNFDPVAYETTDVVGVGENLPFEERIRCSFLSECARACARPIYPAKEMLEF